MAFSEHTGTASARDPQGNGFLLVVSGPSGAGKGTLVTHLIEQRPDCVFSVSATTRPRRSTEVEGREYLFLSKDEFERRREAGFFLETAEVHGNLYGTPVDQVDSQVRAGKVVVLDVDVQGGASVRRVRPGRGQRVRLSAVTRLVACAARNARHRHARGHRAAHP